LKKKKNLRWSIEKILKTFLKKISEKAKV
jgi:hypothetical protein